MILTIPLILISSLFLHSFVFSAPPSTPYNPGETLDPNCSPGDTNCTVYPPLPTYISTTTIVQLNNNLLSFNTGTLKILGILEVLGTTTFNGVSYKWPTNPPLANQFLQADGAGNLQWADVTLSTSGGWTYEGTIVRLQTITDSVAIGTTSAPEKLTVQGNILSTGNLTITGTTTLATTTISRLNISELQKGSILFAGDNGLISQDNSNLFWDNTNKRLGIGTSSPQYTLDLVGTLRAGNTTLEGGSLIWWAVSNPSIGNDYANSVAVDSTGIYVVGFDSIPGNSEWRIEKRSLNDGSLIWSITSNPSSGSDVAYSVAVDSSGIYVVGSDRSPGNDQWRIEKRSLNDGSLIWSVTSNPSSDDDIARSVAVDSTGIYVVGVDYSPGNYQWRIEKRSLNDGSLIWSVTSNPSSGGDYAQSVEIGRASCRERV